MRSITPEEKEDEIMDQRCKWCASEDALQDDQHAELLECNGRDVALHAVQIQTTFEEGIACKHGEESACKPVRLGGEESRGHEGVHNLHDDLRTRRLVNLSQLNQKQISFASANGENIVVS